MEYSPPPLFKQGAPARVKVTVFALISIALLVLDSHLHVLALVRQATGAVLYPFQMVALMPRDAMAGAGSYFSSISTLQKEVRDLKSAQLMAAQGMQQAQFQLAENVQLRKLMGARAHLPVKSLMSEILYDARDASTRKIVLDRGLREGVRLGLPVIDGSGVVGQVTRVFPLTSEVTLLTDKEQAIPVQVLRNGLRSVAYGRGHSGLLDLRFVAPNADIQVGDVLITSGMDGVYPAGLAVAKVLQVQNTTSGAFGGVICQPLAGIDRYRQVLILMSVPEMAPPPPAPPPPKTGGKKPPMPKTDPARDVVPATPPPSGAAPAAAAPAVAGQGVTTPAARPAPAAAAAQKGTP